ncbi:hypothetical protein Plec18167_000447 [Paecilomyces lecythidis]|uniref:Uncharacterized protein n=1 Tax=Paecilomyces lecythidis TaxID=3004212 RepID=A0ABR3YDZ0_9EURO
MADQDEAALPTYRPAKPLPFELRQHCGIYFEEKLYTQALDLLLSILTSGTVASGTAFIPSPQHLALAATFIVHPSTTTRAKTTEEREAANAALRLLRLTNTLVGPIAAKLDTAFSFRRFDSSSRHGGRRRADDSAASRELRDEETEPLNLEMGQNGSLWFRAEDFWHAVGWAFNCSVLHPKRWERWQLWLQFMCEVLEDDWNERIKQLEEMDTGTEPATPSRRRERLLKQSMIYRYLASGSAGHGQNRRILRAIFADGSGNAKNEFCEIFKNELKEPKRDEETLKKRQANVNIDQDEYGDYLSKDEDESDETDTTSRMRPKRPRRTKNKDQPEDIPDVAVIITNSVSDTLYANGGVSSFGGFQSLALRQRLLHILSMVAEHMPKTFMPLEELYHLFVENIRHLPLPAFQSFVSPNVLPHFSPAEHSTLCEFLLFRMRESDAPDTDEPYLNQKKLEECYLPWAANTTTAVDNAKMSILLESLLSLLAQDGLLSITEELKQAVVEGIQARTDKAQDEIRRNQNRRNAEDIEWCWLIESGERLIFLVEDILPLEEQG